MGIRKKNETIWQMGVRLYKQYEEVIMYLIFGFLTTVLSLGIYYALTFTVLDANNPLQLQIANIISWIAGVLFAFFTNRKYVFKAHKSGGQFKQFINFCLSRLSTLIVDMSIMFIAVTLFGLDDKIFKIIAQIIVIILNYVLSKFFVFKKTAKKEEDKD